MIMIGVVNVPDRKGPNGLWLRSFCNTENGITTQYHTRSGVLWRAIEGRCKDGGYTQRKSVRYSGCTNEFSDFNFFTEWCMSKYGYLNVEASGKYWSLDKDLKVPGNKVYGPDTCIFTPANINLLFRASVRTSCSRGAFPKGVSTRDGQPGFQASTYIDGHAHFLGIFPTVKEAHAEWQKRRAKELFIKSELPGIGDELSEVLKYRSELIELQILRGEITE